MPKTDTTPIPFTRTFTLSDLRAWAQTNRDLAHTVLIARTIADIDRARVDAYTAPLLARYDFISEYDGRPIMTVLDAEVQKGQLGRLYLVSDSHGDRLDRFYEELDALHRANGYTGPVGHCPALTAEHRVITAENALIASARLLTGVDHVYGEHRARYIDLLLGACLLARKDR